MTEGYKLIPKLMTEGYKLIPKLMTEGYKLITKLMTEGYKLITKVIRGVQPATDWHLVQGNTTTPCLLLPQKHCDL